MSLEVHSHLDWLNSSSIPSNRLSSLQSCWEYFVANFTWSYTKLTGISFPSGPTGPTSAIWFRSALVYDQVKLAAKYSQQDCRLDSLLDGIEEEFSQSK